MQLYNLSRFYEAHEKSYTRALSEIQSGCKRSHWMWYIFPQIAGLGYSATSRHYAIRNLEEAKMFLNDTYLGGNLREICSALLKLDTDDAYCVFGSPDNMKLQSSMTLFSIAGENEKIFNDVLDKFFDGKKDVQTLRILGL